MTFQKFSKVLIIGIDGMDPIIVQELFSENKLQNFQRLAEEGSFLKLNTSNPPNSPVAWTSIATGVNPGKHNIFDFIKRNPDNYMPELSLSKSVGEKYESIVKAESFWKYTSKAGIPTTIIRWPVTFPTEKFNGKMLSGLGVPDIKGFLSGYSYYAEDVETKRTQNNILKVVRKNDLIETKLFGPKIRTGKNIFDVKEIMQIITIDNKTIELIINNKKHSIKKNQWSNWIKAEFKIGLLKKVSGIFKVYMKSINPFKMYLTTVQIDPVSPIQPISHPKNYSKELAEDIGYFYTLGIPEETAGVEDGRISEKAFLEQVAEIEEEKTKMFWKEFENFKKEKQAVYAFVFDSSDRIQHMFYNKNDNKEIKSYYLKKDDFIGEVLEQSEDKTLLLIVSDHGINSFKRAVSINTWLVENNFMTLTKELKEDENESLFKNVDWNRTQAYAVGFNSIYINLKNREGNGIVEDKEEIINEIINKLEKLNDGKKMVVNKVYRKEDIYSGNYVKDAPDLIIGFNKGYRMSWQSSIGGFTKEIITDNKKKWQGDHLIDPSFVPGVLFSNIKFKKLFANQPDITPTILDALKIKIANRLDGKSLFE
ncbi:MAG: alkaline phosphatase family protein [Nanoarchaeota archaeon]|nr:alkaline phosphatase family protein [Nanoarchaeota archaeon]